MQTDLTSLETLGLAIRSEEDAAKFYAHMSKLIHNALVKEKFESLAREEVKHGKMLAELYHSMSGSKDKVLRIPGEPQTAEKCAVPAQMSDSLEDLFQLAIEREVQAKDFYLKAAHQTSDASGEKMLRYLSVVEEGHAAMLKKELEVFLQDQDWYMGTEIQEFLHVGP